jgi:hypothetical protein
MATTFTRGSPSPRYRELLSQYRHLHVHGEQRMNLPAEKTYNGRSLPRHAANIKDLIDRHQARTLLDYGSGKGHQYRPMEVRLPDGRSFPSIPAYWGVKSITCYDPAYEPFSQLPTGCFDGVICTDVLEHCPEQDIEWILGELFGFASAFVFANVACYPAMKHLPNGENAHCTVRGIDWWRQRLQAVSATRPEVRYEFLLDELIDQPDGCRSVQQHRLTG